VIGIDLRDPDIDNVVVTRSGPRERWQNLGGGLIVGGVKDRGSLAVVPQPLVFVRTARGPGCQECPGFGGRARRRSAKSVNLVEAHLARRVEVRSVMRSAIIVALLVVAIAGTASAQPGVTAPSAAAASPTQAPGEERSETTALLLSLGGTAASWTALVAGFEMEQHGQGSAGGVTAVGGLGTLLAPSFGHWYAGAVGGRGLGLRLAGLGVALLAVAYVANVCEDECNAAPAQGILLVGAGLYLAGTIESIATAPGAARRYNHRFQNVAIVPMLRRGSDGIAIAGRF
jgi:hypothetical protein